MTDDADPRDLGGVRLQVRAACVALARATLALRAGQPERAATHICLALRALHVAEGDIAPPAPRCAKARAR